MAAFVQRYGDVALFDPAHPYVTVKGRRALLPVQVELDAMDPNDLRALFTGAVDEFWDTSAFEAALAAEVADREYVEVLAMVAQQLPPFALRRVLGLPRR